MMFGPGSTSLVIFPLPIDLMSAFEGMMKGRKPAA